MMQFSLILFNSSCVNLFPDRFSREVSGFGALQGAFHPNHDPHLPIKGWSAKFSHVLFHKLKMFGEKKGGLDPKYPSRKSFVLSQLFKRNT